MPKILYLSTLLLCTVVVTAQSPYEISMKKDVPLFTIGAVGMVTGFFLEAKLDPMTLAEIEALDPKDVNSFDRKGIFNYVDEANVASDFFKYAAWGFPFTLAISKRVRNDVTIIGILGAEAFLWNAAFTTMTKALVKRKRPFTYNPDVALNVKQRSSAKLSFYSGHTSGVSVLSFYSAKVFCDYHPDSKWKPAVWAAAVLLPSTTGYLRYKAGKHFKTDVMTGVVAGALVGILVPHIHKKKNKEKKVTLSLLPIADGVGLALNW